MSLQKPDGTTRNIFPHHRTCMQVPASPPLALGPLGTWEMIIIAVVMLMVAAVVGGIVFLVIYLGKKR